MKIRDIIIENKLTSVTTAERDGITLEANPISNQEIHVTAYAHGRELGSVLFMRNGNYLESLDLRVEERYRGQGIARVMYDYMKELGFKILRSPSQTAAGAGFWNKHRGEQEMVWEGGWDTIVTQGTVIHPSVVKAALTVAQQFVQDFNRFLKTKNIPPIQMGYPTGSSAYHDVDPEDKIYGDIDLQIIVPDIEATQGLTMAQAQTFWYRLEDEFVKTVHPRYVHAESDAGHPILAVGQDSWVQVDLMPHTERLATWGRFRTTPERGIKGMLNGNMFSVFGELLNMSIQHSGVQFKVRDRVKLPYSKTRKDYELVTLTTNIETFVRDVFMHEAEEQGIKKPKISPLLKQYPGSKLDEVKISNLVNAIKGFAESCELNGMYGQGDLAPYASAEDFLDKFWQIYEAKAMKDIGAAKRDKAETPQARARAEDDKKKILQGLDYVKGMFQ